MEVVRIQLFSSPCWLLKSVDCFVVVYFISVFNWGTYRDLNGILGFAEGVDKQVFPHLIEELQGNDSR